MKELKITNDRKKTIKAKEIFFDTDISIKNTDGLGYLIFCYETIRVKYGMIADDLNLLLYLHKICVFPIKIKVIDKVLTIKDLYSREYVVSDYSINNKQLYKLSNKGLSIIRELDRLIKNTDDFIKYNREIDIDLESKMKSVLKAYGNKIR